MIRPCYPTDSGISIHRLLLVSCALLCFIPGIFSSRVVKLGSIQIFNAHEWLAPKPTVYFYCQGENKTILPDVKEKHFYYTFKGEESWQPLTELPDKKCKRCGLYEKDQLKSDDVFDEWELCPDEFVDGKYVRYKEKEFNATFICNECTPAAGSAQTSDSKNVTSDKRTSVIAAVMVAALVAVVVVVATLSIHKYWQKRKRERDQARFLKLFEDDDDIDDELGLGL